MARRLVRRFFMPVKINVVPHQKNVYAAESKSSLVARLIALESGGRARWTPRDYAALAREGYARNAIVYRAVRLIAESVGALCFVLTRDEPSWITHPLLDLVWRGRIRARTARLSSKPSPRIFCSPAMPMSRR